MGSRDAAPLAEPRPLEARRRSRWHPPPRVGPYVIATLSVAVATIVRAALEPVLHGAAPFAFHFLAVAASAWLGGVPGGATAVLLSLGTTDFFFIPPRFSFAVPDARALAGLAVFSAVSGTLVWMTTRWRRADQAARHSQDLLHSMMEHFPTVIAFTDRDGHFIEVNAAFERRLGVPRAQILGRTIDDLLPDPEARRLRAHAEEVMQTRRAAQHEGTTQLPDGTRHHLDTLYPLVDADGDVEGTGHISHDVTSLRQVQEALHRSERTLTALMDASTESIWLLDREHVLVANVTAAQRLNLTVDQLLGAAWRTLFPPEVAERRGRMVEQVFATARPVRFEDERNGIHFDHSFYPAFDATGAVTAVAAFSRDVTEQHRRDEALRERTRQLDTANQLKEDFLATLSHELRTPINTILGWSQILETTEFAEDRWRRGLATIARNARLQASMVEDLLDVSRIVTGRLRLEVQLVDVRTAIEQAVDGIGPGAAARQLHLTTEVTSGLVVRADPGRLQQVLWNLLSNAVKFTPPGGTIALAARATCDGVDIEVRDTGSGIAADFLPHVFERFRQGDSSPTREHGGLGLGLAIVRHIVELHGGVVRASSEGVGRGAVFTVTLPRVVR